MWRSSRSSFASHNTLSPGSWPLRLVQSEHPLLLSSLLPTSPWHPSNPTQTGAMGCSWCPGTQPLPRLASTLRTTSSSTGREGAQEGNPARLRQ